MFMIAFWIHCNFFIVLPFGWKRVDLMGFFLDFYKANWAHPKNRTHMRGFARQSAPDRHPTRFSSGVPFIQAWIYYDNFRVKLTSAILGNTHMHTSMCVPLHLYIIHIQIQTHIHTYTHTHTHEQALHSNTNAIS